MKRILIALLISVLAYGCTTTPVLTRDQKADTLIKHFLDSTLNDPKSYEPVKFGKIDTLFTHYMDDPGFEKLPISGDYQRTKDLTSNFSQYEKRTSNGYYDDLNKINKRATDSLKKTFKPEIRAYYVEHTFRAKNAFNALLMQTVGFSIDTSFTEIVNTKKVD